jgi:ferrochelatase
MAKTGVLLVHFGGADCLEAVEPFMSSVMGRVPSEEILASTRRRYLTIGGGSPLPILAERMACSLERVLSGLPPAPAPDPDAVGGLGRFTEPGERATEGVTVPVEVGMLHWRPAIEEGVARLADRDVTRVVWVSLSPFESVLTTEAFRSAVETACGEAGLEAVEGSPYHSSDAFAALLADIDIGAVGMLVPDYTPAVVFTAHSLPTEELGDGSYVKQLEALATLIAETMGLGAPDREGLATKTGLSAHGGPGKAAPWLLAYQSQGQRPGTWLGPELGEVIEAVKAAGLDSVAVCPIGFVMDHLETLYDLDVEAADMALSSDLEFSRANAANDDPIMVEIIAEAVRPHL